MRHLEALDGIGRDGLFYDGRWQPAFSPRRLDLVDPSNGHSLGQVVDADATDVEAAVRAAGRAFPAWRALKPADRGRALTEAARRLRADAPRLAAIDAINAGLPLRAMLGDVEMAAAQIEYFAGLVRETKGETLPLGDGALNYSLREPLGVVLRIHPFNHPLMFAAAKVAAALAAGNTVIGKPAEQTPLSALALAEIWSEIFPPGVFNLVTGGRACGAALVEHAGIAKVGVIGSTETGRAVMRSAAGTLKKIALELGGKNALVAFPDADPDRLAAACVQGMNLAWTAGQSCGATTRIYLHDEIHDVVVGRIRTLLAAIRLGRPIDPDCEMGCLVSRDQQRRVMEYIASGIREGATLAFGGGTPGGPLAQGCYVEPTLFTGVRPDMRIAREEIFGPVMSVLRWNDAAQMIAEVNALDYGLAASIWTRDLARAHRTAMAIEAGYIWINGVGSHALGAAFGGYKASGLGREECLEELLSYTQTKNVNITLDA